MKILDKKVNKYNIMIIEWNNILQNMRLFVLIKKEYK